MKPIETAYRGYKFRSRLEARWAVFFDVLQIKWEYEPQGFHLSNGEMYLPDFYLPGFNGGIFAEVKPEQSICPKARQFAIDQGCPVLMLCGTPDCRVYWMISGKGSEDSDPGVAYEHMFADKYLPGGRNGCEYRLFCLPGYENEDGTIDMQYMDDGVLRAITAARSARFEHGSRPPTDW